MIWIIAVIAGMIAGTFVGAIHGWLIAYRAIPAFIVTLGGLLVWRGVAFLITSGETISPSIKHSNCWVVDPTVPLAKLVAGSLVHWAASQLW